MAMLKAGDKAPDFSLTDQNGDTVKLSQFKGRKLLVYFYPKADTSGCVKQACSVRDAAPDFGGLNVAAVGISPDKPDKQKKFDAEILSWIPLTFRCGQRCGKGFRRVGREKDVRKDL